MRTYFINVTRIQSECISVSADSDEEALRKVEDEVMHRHPSDECWDDPEYEFDIGYSADLDEDNEYIID